MIPRLHKRGTSFKGACGYILHDAQKTSRDRVLWSDTRNLISQADDAWFEMFATARDQAALKEQSGQSARGRKNTKPVLHYTLSWAIGENPTPEHMRETALSSLNMLGLGEHQAVMAAHSDKEHMHVHIVVNTIHPETGLTASLKYTKERLSRWAEAYEREHGIHCEERIRNNAERDRLARARDGAAILMLGDLHAQPAKPPYVPVKHRGPNRQQWFTQKELKNRMSRLRAEMDLVHKGERSALWQKQVAVREALDDNTRAAVEQARSYVKDQFRLQWRDLYRVQKREGRHVANATLFERAVFVFSQRERLGLRKPLSFRQAVSFIRHPGKLLDRIDAVHERERRGLAQVEKAETRTYTETIWTRHRAKADRLIADQAADRQVLRDRHFARTRGVTLQHAKASLAAELHREPANDKGQRALTLKERMAEWRARNEGRDYGREM